MFVAKGKIFPVHLHPPVLQIVEGKTSDFQRDDGIIKPLNIKRHSVQVEHRIEDGRGMTFDAFFKKAEETGEALGKEMWETITGAITESVAETGNEIKIKKGSFTQEDMLKMIEVREHNFDEDGNPTGQMVCGSELAKELKYRFEEWKDDKVFLAKVAAITQRKRAEFNEREARRRLVG